MAYTDFGLKNSPLSMKSLLPKLINAHRKLIYPNERPKGKPLIQKDPLKGTPPNNYRLIMCLPMILFTNPSARAGYDTRSIFKRSLTGLNSEFSFS